jgi:2-iminobutanoate/2-iminopropanoate deaminase
MNRRVLAVVVILLIGGFAATRGAFSQSSGPMTRKAINLPDSNPALPFSAGILAGNTFYMAGAIGLDKSGKAPADVDEELRLLMEQYKRTLAAAGMTMDDLVYVQIACTDLSLYDKFNTAYRAAFSGKEFPAREFIGVASILRGGHFEMQAIAVKR